ncbi:MAG: hypothetical protein RMK92_12185 [Armatimonadota bacterium]|nr:hypothetical protein [Armatimonadota bacterium]
MRIWTVLCILVTFVTGYASAQVVFYDDFERYLGQSHFEQYDNPSDLFDPIWLTRNVWHGQIAPPNLQLVNVRTPYSPPPPYLPQPADAKARGAQSLWLAAGAHRANFLNLSAPLGVGAYVNWWFYDTGSRGKQANAWVELLFYTNGLLDVGAGVTAGQVESFSLGAASFDPRANLNTYQVRGDISDPAYYPPDSFASQGGGALTWANFGGTTRAPGWHQAAIWLWKPNEVLFILDGVTKSEPRNPAYGATTVRLRGLASNTVDFYFDDVTVGVGIPPAMPRANTSCQVSLTDFVGDYSQVQLQLEIRHPNDTSSLEVQYVVPTESGSLQVALPEGTWDLAFKADRSLRRVLRAVRIPSSGTLNVSLRGGDADGDNEVSLLDFGKLLAVFGKVAGEPGFEPTTDFDGDGEVNLLDFGILLRHFGLVGDE